jgi:hypothetical protein
MVSGLKSNVYEERLRELNLPTLLERRHQADMAMVHKILYGRGGLDHTTWFEKAEHGLRTTRSTADPYNLSETWQAGSEEKLLQHTCDRGLEQHTGRSERSG